MLRFFWRMFCFPGIALSLPINRRPMARRRLPERLEPRQLMAADMGLDQLMDMPVLDVPAAGQSKIYTVLPLAESNAGGKGGSPKPPSGSYTYSVVGNAANVAVNALSSGLALAGGGTDVDEVFRWLGGKANGGDFVVIRASGTGDYNPYIDALVPALDSVATLVISTVAAANDPFVAQTIRDAEAIFIAGGDQANYIDIWTDTGVESAIYEAMARGAPIGGTSAGLAVLSEFDFSAQNGTITSAEALANPYDSRVVLDTGFLSESGFVAAQPLQQPPPSSVLRYLDNLVTDSHFQQRDRMGRLITFMARIDQDGPANDPPRGLGVNEQTAVLIEPSGMSRIVGNPYTTGRKAPPVGDQSRAAYLLTTTVNTTKNVMPGQLLTYTDLAVTKADYNPTTGIGDTFDFATWAGISGVTNYQISSSDVGADGDADLVSTSAAGAIY
jgi:cyanophycinase